MPSHWSAAEQHFRARWGLGNALFRFRCAAFLILRCAARVGWLCVQIGGSLKELHGAARLATPAKRPAPAAGLASFMSPTHASRQQQQTDTPTRTYTPI
jgi:hypothetical protein